MPLSVAHPILSDSADIACDRRAIPALIRAPTRSARLAWSSYRAWAIIPIMAFSSFGDLSSWASVLLTLIASVAAVIGFIVLRRRERRQALTELHASLTSGETAHARHIVGSLLYSHFNDDRPERNEAITAYFHLVWAIQRARNVFRTYGLHWRSLAEPQRTLSNLLHLNNKDSAMALTWNLVEIAENVRRFHEEWGAEWGVEDADAWADVLPYIGQEAE